MKEPASAGSFFVKQKEKTAKCGFYLDLLLPNMEST